jgi:hypothetical protein
MKKWVLITPLLMCVVVPGAQVVLPPPFPRTKATRLLDMAIVHNAPAGPEEIRATPLPLHERCANG